MKKQIRRIIAVTLLAVQALLSGNVVYGVSNGELSSMVERIPDKNMTVNRTVFGDGCECVVKLECFPEMSGYDSQLGTTVYKRMATAIGEFFYSSDDSKSKIPDKKVACSLSVTFTYDKKGFVKVEKPNREIISCKYKFGNNKWDIKQSYEIFTTQSECMVSQISMVLRDRGANRHLEYIDNTHLDLICSVNGDIRVNSRTIKGEKPL